jgi:SAM-dependent methyltransferase
MAPTADDIFADGAFARLYDSFNPWGPDDDFYLSLARERGGPVLDLGCGTGSLACRIAQEISPVAGLDPAPGMLGVARARPGARGVEWIEGDARTFSLSRRFNLIYLTGHAFQVFLTDEEVLAVLRNAAGHLGPDGRLAFETRNPAARAWLSWTPAESRDLAMTAEDGRVEEFCEAIYDPATGIAELTHHYRFLDKATEQVGHSRLRFMTQACLAELTRAAGLAPQSWYGDWDRRPYSPESEEIILVAGLR